MRFGRPVAIRAAKYGSANLIDIRDNLGFGGLEYIVNNQRQLNVVEFVAVKAPRNTTELQLSDL
jgi:hypothetical protein